jgi:Ca-activated chloride channel homolog
MGHAPLPTACYIIIYYLEIMHKKYFTFHILFVLFFHPLIAQNVHKALRDGDEFYEKKDFKNAEAAYKSALTQSPNSAQAKYNLGNALYKQGNLEEAAKQYSEIAENTAGNNLRSHANYNLGNSHYEKQEYEKSIAAYKAALRANPSDMQAKQNLAIAQKKQQQKQEKEKQEQEKKDKQQKSQKEEKNEDDKNKKKEDQEKKQSDNAQNQQDQRSNQEKQEERDKDRQQQLKDKQDMQQLLKIMDAEEQKVQKKVKKGKGDLRKQDKDW